MRQLVQILDRTSGGIDLVILVKIDYLALTKVFQHSFYILMNKNTCLFYKNVIEVYEGLILFCNSNGFKIKEDKEKFYFLSAKKSSILFWKNLRLELEIQTSEKKQVIVTVTIYKFGKRNEELESEYISMIEKYLNNLS